MAYKEIEQWRQILESADAEQKAYDEACERRATEARELDEKDFWECDQAVVDPKTLGMTDETDDVEGVTETESDLEEEIVFDNYKIDELNEADMREPLTAVSTALGKPASTANLDGENSVKLAEAINRLAEALSGKKIEEEDEDDDTPVDSTEEGWLAWVGGENAIKRWDGMARKSSRELFDDLVKKGVLDGHTGKKTAKATAADMAKMARDYKQATGVELPEDPDEAAATLEKREADSKKALELAKKFYDKWLDDPDFREMNALKDDKGETLYVSANWEKSKKPGKVIAGTDPNSSGAQMFKTYFDAMTPEDQAEFDSWAMKRQQSFTTKNYAPWVEKNQNKKGSLHSTNGDDDHENPLAQHGVDQTFNADNADDDMYGDPEAGDEFYSQFDQNESHAANTKLIMNREVSDLIRQIKITVGDWAKKNGMTAKDGLKLLSNEQKYQQIVNTVLDNQRNRNEMLNHQLSFIFQALTPAQRQELKSELETAAGNDRLEKRFIDILFKWADHEWGTDLKPSQEDFNFLYGIGGDQGGRSGNGTQYDDRHLGMLVAAIAKWYYGDDDEQANALLRYSYSQAPTKSDKEKGIEPRRYFRHLLCKTLQELYDELLEPNEPAVEIPQSPAIGPNDGQKITGKEWDKVKMHVAGLCHYLKLHYKSDLRNIGQTIEDVFEQKYGAFDDNGNMTKTGTARVRKMVTRLDRDQNNEFQQLIDDYRNGSDSMSLDKKLRLLQLDYMRFGKSEQLAADMAQKDFDRTNGNEAEFNKKITTAVKTFLSGGSTNVNKDTIK